MKWRARWPCMPWENCTPMGPRQKNFDVPAAEPKAVVFYQAALLVCPQNFMAANDLGVVLARSGYYARGPLGLGAQRPHLAAIGQPEQPGGRLSAIASALAGRAARQQAEAVHRAEAQRLRSRQASADGTVQWVDPQHLRREQRRDPRSAPRPCRRSRWSAGSFAGQSRRWRTRRTTAGSSWPRHAPRAGADPPLPGPWSGRPLRRLRRRLRGQRLLGAAEAGKRRADQLAAVCPGRIRRALAAGRTCRNIASASTTNWT